MTRLFRAACASLAVCAAACGPEEVEPLATEVAESTLKGSVRVPDGFRGTPVQLAISGYSSVPPVSSPNAMFSMVRDPAIGVGQDYAFAITGLRKTGDYHVVAVLYMSSGHTTAPSAGTDYIGWTTGKVSLTAEGGEHEVGVIPLGVYQPAPP